MNRNRWLMLSFAATMVLGAATHAQGPAGQAPLEPVTQARLRRIRSTAIQAAIQAGMGLFRVRCADCHGMDARGVRGPDITQVWASGRTDGGLFKTLRNGVPGTEMPAVGLRTPITKSGRSSRTCARWPRRRRPIRRAATPRTARRCSARNCAGCHRVNGAGGRLGPDLSRIGVGALARGDGRAASAARSRISRRLRAGHA